MGIILAPFAPILGILSLFGLGGFNAFTCEKALEFHQENTPKLERRIAELEKEKLENGGTIARLELELRELHRVKAENTQLRQENGSMRERLEAAVMKHHVLAVEGAKISKDTQADMEDLRQWAEKKLKKQADEVDNTNIARWHEKTEYGKKLAEYQRLLRRAAEESGGLNKKLTTKETELTTARGTIERVQRELATARKNLDELKKSSDKELAEERTRHRQEVKIYWLIIGGLTVMFLLVLIALAFAVRGRKQP